MIRFRHALLFAALVAAPAFAQTTSTPAPAPAPAYPAWEQLGRAERELLIAPLREHWNTQPEARARIMQHAQRWQTMTPEQRQHARFGMRRWAHMSPEKREAMHALHTKMHTLAPEERKALKKKWRAMTPEQRCEWLRENPPPKE
jgi:hypothetical protein